MAGLPRPIGGGIRRLILIIGGTALLAGCGVKFAYNQLDWLIPAYIEDYVTLTGDQRTLLQQRLSERLDWHRHTQLPRYACELHRLREAVEAGLSEQVIDQVDAALWRYWTGLMRAVAPDVAELLLTASDEQLDELFRNFERRNRELRTRFVDRPAGELSRERARVMTRHVRRWIGGLTVAQEQALAAWSERVAPMGNARLAHRLKWQQELRRSLARRSDPARFLPAIQRLLVDPEHTWPADYRDKLAHNRAVTKAFLLELDALLTDVQRRRLFARVGSLAGDLVLLAQTKETTMDCATLAQRAHPGLNSGAAAGTARRDNSAMLRREEFLPRKDPRPPPPHADIDGY